MATECTCTEREFGRCSRPTVRPGRNVSDERDHGDGSDTRARGRRTSGSLTETSVRSWQYWPELFNWSKDRTMSPCPLDGTDQRARHVLAAGVEPDGPVNADGDQALVIDDVHHPTFLPGGEAARQWKAATGARVRQPRRRRCSWPRLVAPLSNDPDVAWLINGLAGIFRLIRLDPKNLQSRTIRLQVDATRPGRRLGLV